MGKTIDQRIVEMNFENKQFEKGAEQSLKTIEDLKKGLNFEGAGKGLAGITAAANKVDLSGISHGVDTVANRFSVMGAVAFTIIQDITRKVLDMGRNIANALVITPITTGFEEFELKMGSIQTIMAGTGESLETVNKYLNDLNLYADRTIYSFSDMTQNIGKFTNAGVSLDQSVNAIKGVANVAAVSGANANEASRAMYNFAQALSAGYVKLIDWKSIELANMGTVEFKQQLIDSAVAAGTLTDNLDGTYNTLVGNSLSATKGFNEALTDQWLTTDVLVNTLNRYSDASTEIGAKATAAAQDVKTFTMLMDTLKESLQSGWAYTWELLIGDFEEGKEFFTTINDILGNVIGESANARNDLLQGWKDLGGREDIVQGIYNALNGFFTLLSTIKETAAEIFPPLTAANLKTFSEKFLDLTERFKMAVENMDGLKRVFKAFFALLDIGRMVVSDVVKGLFGLSGGLSPIADKLKETTLGVADFIIGLRDGMKANGGFFKSLEPFIEQLQPYIEKIQGFYYKVKDFVDKIKEKIKSFGGIDLSGIKEFISNIDFQFKPLTTIFGVFGKALKLLWTLIKKFAPVFGSLATAAGEGFGKVLDTVQEWVQNFDVTTIFNAINGGLFAGILLAIKKFVDGGSGIFDGVADILEGVGGALETWQANLKSKTLLNIAAAIAILAISIAVIGSVDSDRVTASLGAMTVLILQLFTAMTAFSKVQSGVKGVATMTAGVVGIATALLLMSLAIKTLANLDPDGLVRGTVALIGIMFALKTVAKELSKGSSGAIKAAIALTALGVALNIIALAVFALGSMKPEKLQQGLIGISVVLAGLMVFLRAVSGTKGLLQAAAAVYILSGALVVMTGAIFLLGSMKVETLQQGLLGMAVALLGIAIAMRLMPKGMIVSAVSLVIVAEALVILAAALRIMGGMDLDQLKTAIIALGASMIIIAAGLYAMQGAIGGAAALIIASGALVILAIALKSLGQMSLKEIGLALLAIVGVLVVLAGAAALMTPIIPSLLALAGALLALGIGAALIGGGILALSIGLTALGTGGAAGISALVLALSAVIGLLPFLAIQVGKALISLIQTIADGGPLLLESIVKILLLFIDAVVTVIPPLVDAVLLLVSTLLTKLAENLPDIIQAGFDILLALLQGIADNIGEVVDTAGDIIINFLGALEEKIPELVGAGVDLVVGVIDGIAEEARTGIPRIIKSVKGLGKAIIDGVLEGIGGGIGDIISGIWNMGTTMINTLKEVLGIASPSEETEDIAGNTVLGFINGIQNYATKAYSTVSEFGDELLSKFNEVTSGLQDTIDSDMEFSPTITPIVDLNKFKAGTKEMNTTLASSNLNIGVSSVKASSIAGDLSSQQNVVNEQGNVVAQPSPIQYIQNNYSPEALSRIDIYRATKNQLKMAKGAIE